MDTPVVDSKTTFRQIPFQIIQERLEHADEVVHDVYSLIKTRLEVFDQEFRFSERVSR